jgi:hypothetical protein
MPSTNICRQSHAQSFQRATGARGAGPAQGPTWIVSAEQRRTGIQSRTPHPFCPPEIDCR